MISTELSTTSSGLGSLKVGVATGDTGMTSLAALADAWALLTLAVAG